MKIAAHIGVKDEIELIEPCIAHLRRIGVTSFIVCEMQSTDGTAEWVAAQRSETFRVLQSSNAEPGMDWLRRNEAAARTCGADWLVFADADEFILPEGGSLAEALTAATADVVRVPRFNVPLGPDGPRLPLPLPPESYAGVDLIVRAIPDFRAQLRVNPSLPWIRAVPVPKVIVRPQKIGTLIDGMHDVLPLPGQALTRALAQNIVTAHLPFSTEARFARKIENIREVFRHHDSYMGANLGWHWRRWLELADRGEISGEFDRTRFSMDTIEALRREGIIMSAADVLSGGLVLE